MMQPTRRSNDMTNRFSARDRSYGMRDEIADVIDAPKHADFTCAALGVTVACEVDDEFVRLISTSNAGFRGIEGRFGREDGERFTASLGDVVSWFCCDGVH